MAQSSSFSFKIGVFIENWWWVSQACEGSKSRQILGIPFAITPLGQLYQSVPSPIHARGTGRAARRGALAPEPPRATGVDQSSTDFNRSCIPFIFPLFFRNRTSTDIRFRQIGCQRRPISNLTSWYPCPIWDRTACIYRCCCTPCMCRCIR